MASSALSTPLPPPLSTLPTMMKRAIVSLSILSYLLSLPALGFAVWLLLTQDYDCEDLLHMPRLRIAIGVGLLLVFIVGNTVVYFGKRFLLPGLLLLAVLLVLMLSIGLTLVGAYRMESRAIPASPMWLRTRIARPDKWSNIKNCLIDSRICSDLTFRTIKLTSYDFSMNKLSPIESGCCKPPVVCGMEYVNATCWNPPKAGDGGDLTAYDSFGDCHAWSNGAAQLCYDCSSCQDGFLVTIQKRWMQLGVFLVVMAVLKLVTHSARFVMLMLGLVKD